MEEELRRKNRRLFAGLVLFALALAGASLIRIMLN